MGIRSYDNVEITGLSASGTTDNLGSWNEAIDLDSFVTIPSGATGVILRVVVNVAAARWYGIRTPGKATAQRHVDSAANERGRDVVCQLGAGNTIDLYAENVTDVKFYILGITDSTWTFLDIDSPTNISSTSSVWSSRTITPSGGTPIAICVDLVGGWRPENNTTDEVSDTANDGGFAAVQLDGSYKAKFKTAADRRIVAEISGGVTFPAYMSAVDSSPTQDSAWHTSGQSYSGKSIASIQRVNASTTYAGEYRKTGSSYTLTAGATNVSYQWAPLNASGQFDYWLETGGGTTAQYVHAWFDDFSSGTTSTPYISLTPQRNVRHTGRY